MNEYKYIKDSETKKGKSKTIIKGTVIMASVLALTAGAYGLGYGVGTTASAGDSKAQEINYTSTGGKAQLTSSIGQSTDTIDVIKEVSDAVVSINTTTVANMGYGRSALIPSAGSGIIIHEDDNNIYLVTNEHVISDARDITISIDDNVQIKASLIGSKYDSDLAVLKVSKADLEASGVTDYKVGVFADSSLVEVGEEVIAIGNAAGEGKSATKGIISAIDKVISLEDGKNLTTLQTDAAINAGNSGGALVNMKGEIVGVNTAKYSSNGSESFEGMGYSIPSNTVKEIAEAIITSGSQDVDSSVGKAALGIKGQTITEMTSGFYNLPVGVFVVDVTEGSSAYDVGIQAGDIITKFDDTTITTKESLGEVLEKKSPGDVVYIELYRDGRLGRVDVTLKSQSETMD